MKKNYQIKNKQQLNAQLSSIKLNLSAKEAGLQQDAKAYLNHVTTKILGKKKTTKQQTLIPKSVQQYLDGKVLIHILPQFVKRYLMKRSGWLSRVFVNLFTKKLSKSLDKTYFEPK